MKRNQSAERNSFKMFEELRFLVENVSNTGEETESIFMCCQALLLLAAMLLAVSVAAQGVGIALTLP